MIPYVQNLCLVGADGKGAAFMDIYDRLHPRIRRYLCDDCTINICLACLNMFAKDFRIHLSDTDAMIRLIQAFEKGDPYDYQRTNRSQVDRRMYEEFRRIPSEADYPPAYFYPASDGAPRYYPYTASGSPRKWLELRLSPLDYEPPRISDFSTIKALSLVTKP